MLAAVGAVAEVDGDAAQRIDVIRQNIGLVGAPAPQIAAVAGRGAQRPCLAQLNSADELLGFQHVQCLQRAVDAQIFDIAGVLELHELHGPFHVRQAALAELQMPFTAHAARQTLGFHAGLELVDVL